MRACHHKVPVVAYGQRPHFAVMPLQLLDIFELLLLSQMSTMPAIC